MKNRRPKGKNISSGGVDDSKKGKTIWKKLLQPRQRKEKRARADFFRRATGFKFKGFLGRKRSPQKDAYYNRTLGEERKGGFHQLGRGALSKKKEIEDNTIIDTVQGSEGIGVKGSRPPSKIYSSGWG